MYKLRGPSLSRRRVVLLSSAAAIVPVSMSRSEAAAAPYATAPAKMPSDRGNYSNTPFAYGAIGDGTADDTIAVQDCAKSGYCWLPAGYTFKVSAPVQIPHQGTFIGAGATSVIEGAGVPGGVVQIGDGVSRMYRCTVGGFKVTGSATNAVKMCNTSFNIVSNIWAHGRFNDGFHFDCACFGNELSHLSTDQCAISNACFWVGGGFNANACSQWYTGDTQGMPYNFFFEDTHSTGPSYGSVFNVLCCQGGVTGLYVGANHGGHTFNGYYSENVVKPIVLGDYARRKSTVGLTFNSPEISGPNKSHPSYAARVALIDFSYCIGVIFNAPSLYGSSGYDETAYLNFTPTDGDAPSEHAYGYLIVNAAGVPQSAVLMNPGSGYAHAPVVAVVGAGSGAVVTATVNAGQVSGLAVVGGKGYLGAHPVIATYAAAYNCAINNPAISGHFGIRFPILPLIRRSTIVSDSTGVVVN